MLWAMKGNETPLIGNPEMEKQQVQVLLSAPIFPPKRPKQVLNLSPAVFAARSCPSPAQGGRSPTGTADGQDKNKNTNSTMSED